jgi:dihydroorotase (multifunctional complex type)
VELNMKRLLKGGHLVDPLQGIDGVRDVLLDGDRVAAVGHDLPAGPGVEVIDVPAGFVICPGFVDMHVHLREPGQEHKETIATGTAAAAAGGFTAVACMPNTSPVNDSAAVTRSIVEKAAAEGLVRVYPIGAVSKGMKGESLSEMADLRAAGCVAFSDDGKPVMTSLLMRRALEYAGMLQVPVIDHCEEPTLKGEGVAHEGLVASQLGLRGIPGAAESIMVDRNIALAEMTGGAVHIAHLSTRQALRGVGAARSRGVKVTCEVTPHHFTLTDERLAGPIHAPPLHAHRRAARGADPVRHQPEDEPAAARAGRRGGDPPGTEGGDGGRDRHRPRTAPGRREARRVRSRAVRDHRPRDGRAAHARPPRARGRDHSPADGAAADGEPVPDPERAGRDAARG